MLIFGMMRVIFRIVIIVWLVGLFEAGASERDRGLLLGGVTEIEFGKAAPGVLEVSAPAFPILSGVNG